MVEKRFGGLGGARSDADSLHACMEDPRMHNITSQRLAGENVHVK
jgi:hypothetical protein